MGRSASETKVSVLKYIVDYSSLKLLRIGGDLEKEAVKILEGLKMAFSKVFFLVGIWILFDECLPSKDTVR